MVSLMADVILRLNPSAMSVYSRLSSGGMGFGNTGFCRVNVVVVMKASLVLEVGILFGETLGLFDGDVDVGLAEGGSVGLEIELTG